MTSAPACPRSCICARCRSDYLKIDGQFIAQIAADPVDRSMVEAIGKVGRALGIATIAECVETAVVLEELKRLGVDFAPGLLHRSSAAHLAAKLPVATELAPRKGCRA